MIDPRFMNIQSAALTSGLGPNPWRVLLSVCSQACSRLLPVERVGIKSMSQ